MFRMLNEDEKQYLMSNIENTLQEMQNYISSISLKGKNSVKDKRDIADDHLGKQK